MTAPGFLKETPLRPASILGNKQTPKSFALEEEGGQRVPLVSLEQQRRSLCLHVSTVLGVQKLRPEAGSLPKWKVLPWLG